jgi:hypothetical protein
VVQTSIAGGQQLLDVLPALGMARADRVGVGVFVDQQDLRLAFQGRVDVEFHLDAAAMLDRLARQDLHAAQQALGLAPSVGLDDADQHVQPLGLPATSGAQHLVGLAHAGRHARETP